MILTALLAGRLLSLGHFYPHPWPFFLTPQDRETLYL